MSEDREGGNAGHIGILEEESAWSGQVFAVCPGDEEAVSCQQGDKAGLTISAGASCSD